MQSLTSHIGTDKIDQQLPMESRTLGIDLGPLVPVERYDAVAAAIWTALSSSSSEASEHAVTASMGWTGVGYRARAANDHRESFRSLFDLEPASTHEQRFQQDSHFFGFITNAAAATESLVYAAHAIALGFIVQAPTESLLRRFRSEMVRSIASVGKLGELGTFLERSLVVVGSLFELRDLLLHRGRPPRNHFVGGEYHGRMTLASNPKAVPKNWTNTFVFDGACCDQHGDWLKDLISGSIVHLEQALGVSPKDT